MLILRLDYESLASRVTVAFGLTLECKSAKRNMVHGGGRGGEKEEGTSSWVIIKLISL